MGFVELFLIAVGLSMDAFAVSVCKGLNMRKINYKQAFIIGGFFGGFQALMPFLGWALGKQFEQIIQKFDYWIAFILLAIIGGKMAIEALKPDDEDNECHPTDQKLNYKELFLLAIATSIDALAVGVTFAFMKVSILPSILLIGVTTLTLSVIGVAVGNRFGAKYKNKAEFVGGIVLVLIGVKILIEGLMK